jgi:hypothetical protein
MPAATDATNAADATPAGARGAAARVVTVVRRASLLIALLTTASVLGACAEARTERYCQQAVAERTKGDAARTFPTERFLAACRKLSPADAQCTVSAYAGSPTVLAAKECHSAYMNPAFPKDLLLGTPSQGARGND